jgi:predicted DCC family thiol-disulfide oxidoreductase YuxK
MQLVEPERTGRGARVVSGAAAVVAALNTRRAWLLLTWLYGLPLLRGAIDRLYSLIARNRMRIYRQSVCAEGECTMHSHRRGGPR